MFYTNIPFLGGACELFLISKIRLLDSIEVQLEINGVSVKLKSKLEKYHPPLNNSLFFVLTPVRPDSRGGPRGSNKIYYCRIIRINQLS
jgi:hypothetical protein